MKVRATRYHDISCGHRVVGHEHKCRFLHGHNYRVWFVCEGEQDAIGRVIDFSVMKATLCDWLEREWDHKFLAWNADPLILLVYATHGIESATLAESLVLLPFNPTAENLAIHLVRVVGPVLLDGTGVKLVRCVVEETRKCSAECVSDDDLPDQRDIRDDAGRGELHRDAVDLHPAPGL